MCPHRYIKPRLWVYFILESHHSNLFFDYTLGSSSKQATWKYISENERRFEAIPGDMQSAMSVGGSVAGWRSSCDHLRVSGICMLLDILSGPDNWVPGSVCFCWTCWKVHGPVAYHKMQDGMALQCIIGIFITIIFVNMFGCYVKF